MAPRDPAQGGRRPRGIPIRGDILTQERERRGWTQAEAAEALGIHPRGYQKWEEKGPEARVDPENVTRIAEVFELPPARFLADGYIPPTARSTA